MSSGTSRLQEPEFPLDPASATVKFREGQVLFAQGKPADTLFLIREGMVKITVLSSQGKVAVVALLKAGDFCGESCLGGHAVRAGSAVAITSGVAARMDKEAAMLLIQSNQGFVDRFIAHLLARNIRAGEDLVDRCFNSSEKRLARALLLLADFGKAGNSARVMPAISQETLAEMVGTTRPRVNYFMNKFRKLGFIEYNGHLVVDRSLRRFVMPDDELKVAG